MKQPKTIAVGGFAVTVVRSRRKTLSLSVTDNGDVVARAPLFTTDKAVAAFVKDKEAWLKTALARAAATKREAAAAGALTAEEIADLKAAAKAELPARVAYYAAQMGVSYNRVTVRLQKTRWGSCSAGGNLNFNALLMLAPPEVRDSVVVHELAHRKEMNHSRRFYAAINAVMPDYAARHQWLKDHGAALQARVREEDR